MSTPQTPPATSPGRVHTLRLVLGDQLNPLHSWFAQPQPHVVLVLMELRQETDYVLHHAQKVLGIFAAMRDFARHLKRQGHRVRYVAIDDASNRQSLTANLDALVAHHGAQCVKSVQWQAPDEWRLDQQLNTWGQQQAFACGAADTEHFYTARDAAGDPPRHRQLLYAEDDPVNALLMQAALERLPGVSLQVATTGHAACTLAEGQLPDLLMLDMSLPDMNGHELLARLRRDPRLTGVPAVAVSADAMPEEIARALASGFDGYWTKPLDIHALPARLEALLSRPAAAAPPSA